MRINWRKIYVAAIALQIVIAAYLLITFFGGKSKIEIPDETSQLIVQEDSNSISDVGPIGLGTVEQARFVTLDDNKNISREFGFEKLLHKQGDQWEILNPYINIFQDGFECRLTSKKGTIITDETEGEVDFVQAKLTEDVKITVLPENKSKTGVIEAFMDDIVFIRDRSLFITYGPVKIISRDAQLLGKGFQAVYDTAKSRLDFLKITKLESICVNRIASDSVFAGGSGNESQNDKTSENADEDDPVDKYRAVFTKNVKIRTQNNIVFAKGLLAIHNIASPDNSKDESAGSPSQSNDQPDVLTEQNSMVDLMITCDGSLVVNPMDNDIEQLGISEKTGDRQTTLDLAQDVIELSNGKNALWSTDIDYDAQSRQFAATGPAKISYLIESDQQNRPDLLTITANDIITYDYYKGTALFKGDSLCTVRTHKNNSPQTYTIKSPELAVNLALSDEDNIWSLKNITANGPSVLTMDLPLSAPLKETSQQEKIIVTANKQIKYDDLSNNIIFEGKCYCEIPPGENSEQRRYTLNCDRINVELVEPNDKDFGAAAYNIRTIESIGNTIVKMSTKDSQKSLAEFSAHTVKFEQATNIITAPGPSRLLIFSDTQVINPKQADSPTTITAQEQASFFLADNKAVFEGDCICSMIRVDSDVPRKYFLNAQTITVEIDDTYSNSPNDNGIRNLTAGDNAIITVTPLENNTELAKFKSKTINYDSTNDTIKAKGPCDFTFYANDFMPDQTIGMALPVHIIAQESTEFLQSQNQIVFKGDCLCTMVRAKDDIENKYTLSSETITLNLIEQNKTEFAMSTLEIEKINASGKLVQLSNVATQSNKLIGFSKLKCKNIEYNTANNIFNARGPGLITIDNSRINYDKPASNKVTFTKKCYAFLRGFENLNYDLKNDIITSHNNSGKILVDYFPIIQDQNDQQQIKASAGMIEIKLDRSLKGKSEISTLTASGGITYEDSDNQFIADRMVYDAITGLIKADSGGSQKCYLNGAIIDNIIYDINRAVVLNLDITSPGRIDANK